jgi:hypothetical protein
LNASLAAMSHLLTFCFNVAFGLPATLILGNEMRWNGDMVAIACVMNLREFLEDLLQQ